MFKVSAIFFCSQNIAAQLPSRTAPLEENQNQQAMGPQTKMSQNSNKQVKRKNQNSHLQIMIWFYIQCDQLYRDILNCLFHKTYLEKKNVFFCKGTLNLGYKLYGRFILFKRKIYKPVELQWTALRDYNWKRKVPIICGSRKF